MKNKLAYLAIATPVIVGMIILSDVEKTPVRVAKPVGPPFVPAERFDGRWLGERRDISGDDICLESKIVGEIVKGEVRLKLVYNNTNLSGWISEAGKVVLYSDSQRWGYRFSGELQESRIAGDWKVTNAVCHGSWFVEQV